MGISITNISQLLIDVRIDQSFVASYLQQSFSNPSTNELVVVCNVVSTAISTYDAILDQSRVAPEGSSHKSHAERMEEAQRGKSFIKKLVPFDFQPGPTVHKHLASLLDCDSQYIAKQAKIFREINLKKNSKGYQPQKYDWERAFVEYFVGKFAFDIENRNKTLTSQEERSATQAENLSRLNDLVQELRKQFSLPTPFAKTFPNNWQPPLQFATFLQERRGIQRKYVYCQPVISSFRNYCVYNNVTETDACTEYYLYLMRHEPTVATLVDR